MTRTTITHATEADWLAARQQDITSTEAAALFGAGAYIKTPYELYHRKIGTIADDFQENDRTRWGNRLEDAIARGIAEDLGLIVEPFKVYMRIPSLRMGSSFDFKITGIVEGFDGDNDARRMFAQHGPGVMEVKNVDGLQFKRAWLADGETIEAPVHIEFQVQHQLEVCDLSWSIIAPLVGGNTPRPVIRVRDRNAGAAIREKVAEMWRRIDTGNEPQPDYTRDGDAIAEVYRDNDGTSVDLSHDERLAELCRAYKAAGADEKAAKERKDAAKAEILTIIKQAKAIVYDGGKISAGTNKASFRAYYRNPGERLTITLTEVAGADVEANVPAFRNVRITEKEAA